MMLSATWWLSCRLGAMSVKYLQVLRMASISRLACQGISSKIAAMVSTGGWEEKPAMEETAQSMAPAPARTAST